MYFSLGYELYELPLLPCAPCFYVRRISVLDSTDDVGFLLRVSHGTNKENKGPRQQFHLNTLCTRLHHQPVSSPISSPNTPIFTPQIVHHTLQTRHSLDFTYTSHSSLHHVRSLLLVKILFGTRLSLLRARL